MLGILLLATAIGCTKASPVVVEKEVVSADGMADSAETAAADLAKNPQPETSGK